MMIILGGMIECLSIDPYKIYPLKQTNETGMIILFQRAKQYREATLNDCLFSFDECPTCFHQSMADKRSVTV